MDEFCLVRYRSRRDFLKVFCGAPPGALLDKLASVESTVILGAHIPVLLWTTRVVVGLLLLVVGLGRALVAKK